MQQYLKGIKYCNKIYKYASGLSRHVKSCQDKKALEHFLGDKLKAKNMSLDEFIEIRDMHQSKQNQVITQQVINNNVIHNNTTNVQINMINICLKTIHSENKPPLYLRAHLVLVGTFCSLCLVQCRSCRLRLRRHQF